MAGQYFYTVPIIKFKLFLVRQRFSRSFHNKKSVTIFSVLLLGYGSIGLEKIKNNGWGSFVSLLSKRYPSKNCLSTLLKSRNLFRAII